MSSFSSFDNNVMRYYYLNPIIEIPTNKKITFRDAFLVPILDILTGFYAGFAVFTVLGNMYLTKCVNSFSEVAAQGPELAFVVYPEGFINDIKVILITIL